MVLVVGASGTLGTKIVDRLLQRGLSVVAATRDPSRLAGRTGIDVRRVDVREPQSLRDAVDGAGTVVSVIHGIAPPTRNNHPGIVDGTGTRSLIDVAAAAGVSRFLLLSVEGAAPDARSRFARIKHETEEHLDRSGLDYTVVRPPAFMEVHALQRMGQPLLAGKAVQFVGKGETPMEWVSADDVADVVVNSLSGPDRSRATVRVRGPDTMSHIDALEILEAATGRTAKRTHLPVWAATLLKTVGGWFNPGLGYLMEAAIAQTKPPGRPTQPPDIEINGTTTLRDLADRWAATVEVG